MKKFEIVLSQFFYTKMKVLKKNTMEDIENIVGK